MSSAFSGGHNYIKVFDLNLLRLSSNVLSEFQVMRPLNGMFCVRPMKHQCSIRTDKTGLLL